MKNYYCIVMIGAEDIARFTYVCFARLLFDYFVRVCLGTIFCFSCLLDEAFHKWYKRARIRYDYE